MNKLYLFMALAFVACGQPQPPQPAPELVALRAEFKASIDSLKQAYQAKAAHIAPTTPAPAAVQAATITQTAAGTVCPETYTPRKGAHAGQPQAVKTGSRGGCYYINASGNKTYLPK